ncbi:MAG: T9SS type A sorting domain-containing protein, partial [Bacteroidetes bacterium]|nr:T9SS type A sorting domain-containing protein [Bacteroidota bacterium]
TSTASVEESEISVNIFPNPVNDLLIIQLNGLNKSDLQVELIDLNGRIIVQQTIGKGSTIGYVDVSTVYTGNYLLKFKNQHFTKIVPLEVMN